MKKFFSFAAIAAVLFSSCSKFLPEEAEMRTITFNISNYEQISMDSITRASSADVLDHLTLAIFNTDNGEIVQDITTKNKGDKGYGSFSVSLPYGNYQLTFLGYNGTRLCNSAAINRITFAEDYVPHTFLLNKTMTVDVNSKGTQSIVLKRAVAAFTLSLKDVVPAQVDHFEFKTQVGGTSLNPQTGYTDESAGRTNNVSVTNAMKTNAGATLNTYLFLPEESVTLTYQVTAYDANGQIVRQRTFNDVPMTINCKTKCEGEFFSDDSFVCNLQVDDTWGAQTDIAF